MKRALICLWVSGLCLVPQIGWTFQADLYGPSIARINEDSVRKTIEYLASDELAGRGTPSPGFTIASEYVAKRFEDAGLEPAGSDGWYQNHTIETQRIPTDGIQVAKTGDEAIRHFGLLAATDSALDYSGPVAEIKLSDEFADNQFSGPVMTVDDNPGSSRRYLNNLARAANRLKKAGATALIIVVPENHTAVELAKSLAGKDRVAERSQRIPVPILLVEQLAAGDEITIKIPAATRNAAVVRNTIGVLRGSDPALSAESILFTAHLDHLGADPTAKGDGIYNGADDDASGVTAVVTLAEAFAALPVRPKRSILFMTFWGEEQGLLGSKQFAEEPTWPLEKIVANINIEMIGRPEAGTAGKIWMTGWNESSLGELMAAAAKPSGGVIFEHPDFSAMLYRASDNWSLASKGVIAHSFSAGSLHEDYHQVSDEWEKLDTRHMTRVIELLFLSSQDLANGAATPQPAANRR